MHLHRRKSDGYLYAIHHARPDESYTAVPVIGSYPGGVPVPPITHFEVWDTAEWDPEVIAVTSRRPDLHYAGQPECNDISAALGKLHSVLGHFVRDLGIETPSDCGRLGDDQAIRLVIELLRAKCASRIRDTDTDIAQLLARMCYAYACSSGSIAESLELWKEETEEAISLTAFISDMDRLVDAATKYTIGVQIAKLPPSPTHAASRHLRGRE